MKNLLLILMMCFSISGCILTKVVSTPLRVVGNVVSIIPIVGDGVETILDSTADSIDVVGIVLD
jgi:hypothetical protein